MLSLNSEITTQGYTFDANDVAFFNQLIISHLLLIHERLVRISKIVDLLLDIVFFLTLLLFLLGLSFPLDSQQEFLVVFDLL
jgi:hypothetical protein